jgi:putative transferase (TIGR04331 family)
LEKIKNHLVLVYDHLTWRNDARQIFISKSCLLYRDRDKWTNLKYQIAEPYGTGEKDKIEDHKLCQETIARIFPFIVDLLNEYHELNYSQRQWKIIIGHWLEIFISAYINRYKSLDKCLKENSIESVTFYDDKKYSLSTEDIYTALWASNDCIWNSVLFSRIFSEMGIDLNVNTINPSYLFFSNKVSIVDSYKNRMLKNLKKILTRISTPLSRNTDAYIANTFLPKLKECSLNILFRQFPVVWKSSNVGGSQKLDALSRGRLSQALDLNSRNIFEKALYRNIFDAFPKAYIENFSYLKKCPEKLGWPKSPKFIFTSNNFFADEIFKIWVAQKIMEGVKYIVGQHGNNYGTSLFVNPSVEEDTSDIFLTWGWNRSPKYIPSFILKCPKVVSNRKPKKNRILLIENTPMYLNKTWDVAHEFDKYFEQQKKFVSLLDEKLKKELVVRLHREHSIHLWGELERWTEVGQALKINTGLDEIGELVDSSKLVVHSYDSTGILETLSQNIPTMAFWEGGTNHLVDSAMSNYKILYEAGILHYSTVSITNKINQTWGDIDSWWNSQLVQNAREIFCQRYAQISKSPVIELRNIICREIKY